MPNFGTYKHHMILKSVNSDDLASSENMTSNNNLLESRTNKQVWLITNTWGNSLWVI